MALNKQPVDVIFTKGVSQKTNNQLTLNESLIKLENRVFNKLGRLDKRTGFSVLSNNEIEDSELTPISNMNALSKFGEDELVLFANQNLYSYSPSVGGWIVKDLALSAAVELDAIINGSSQQADIDSCYADGITLFSWVDGASSDIMYALYDTVAKTIINTGTVSTTGDSPRCLAVGSNLFVFYGDGTDLKCKFASTSNPFLSSTAIVISNSYEDLHADHLYDVTAIGSTGYVFYKATTATTIQALKFNTAGAVTSETTLTATVTGPITLCSFLAADTKYYIALGYKQSASLVKGAVYNQSFVAKVAIATVDSTASTDISMLSIGYSTTDDKIQYFYQTDNADTTKTLIRTNSIVVDTGVVGTSSVFLRSVGIGSRAFTHDDIIYMNVLHESEFQSTMFTVATANKVVVCTFAKGRSGAHSNIWAPPSVSYQTNGTYAFSMNVKGVIRSENETLFSLLGLSLATIDFSGPYLYNSITLNNNMLAVGGNVLAYDGRFVTEQGFHLFPENVTQQATATTGGFISNGSYQYAAVYRWTDAKGNIHTSAPSIPLSYTASGGTSTQTITIRIPTLRITQKTGDRGECTVELFRTENAGTIFYKVTSITSPTYNDTTADYVDIVDTLADATIISNEILYTTGGVLDNIGAPSASIITSYKNRAFIAGLEDKNEMRYSKIVRLGEGVSFNEGLSIKVEPRGGDITALATLDDRLIIFKNSSIYQIAGDGPSDTGEGSTFTEPVLISTDVGCTDGNSVVLGPDGLFFKSSKGIYLLERNNTVTYVGADVEDYNSAMVTSAVLLDNKNEMRFSTEDGFILVYNYYFKQWSVFTGNTLNDALIYDDKYTMITSGNKVLQEAAGVYKDDGSFVNSAISTGWIRLSGLQGYQRAYRVGILGTANSAHSLRVSVYTDYSDIVVQERVFDVGSIMQIDSGFYGDDTYGDNTYGGGEDNGVYLFQIHMKQQKCDAIRFVIEDIYENSDTDNSGQGADITGLTVQIGVKQGLNKVRDARVQ